MPIRLISILARPAVLAVGGGIASYVLYKKNRSTNERLRDARIELLEQQRTIDRLRAEVGRERHLRRDDQGGPY